MARKLFIAGNWKLNHTAGMAALTIHELRAALAGVNAVDVAVCPPFTSLSAAVTAAAGSSIEIGAQNMHWAANGAFTGEISAAMLLEIPVRLVVLGHSERRQYFGETDATVNLRLQAALAAGIRPIVCIGETLAERESGGTETVVSMQLAGSLAGITNGQMATVTLAYEPVWAIGTGKTASPEQAQAVHAHIRAELTRMFGADVAEATRIQYGGSVKASNARELMSQPDIDGALVGGASLKVEDFAGIIKAVS